MTEDKHMKNVLRSNITGSFIVLLYVALVNVWSRRTRGPAREEEEPAEGPSLQNTSNMSLSLSLSPPLSALATP